MGVAAYGRGTALNRRQMDHEFDLIYRRLDLERVIQLVRDIERLDAGIKDASESFH